ncbi:BREX-1 system phosphatase PglZ type B [Methanofollis formosanus]|uniref:BREX-1 system phosphatase PglZ type B n=1 Tax=Methanofollis formosanus TaxID=299308 RepID=A0A8G1EFB8_9EURY|nr:BREX-1 system phosphatase PglZ type B [Methanofollis formosanus]QYZ78643.1 BREX-1 system phosphatase PglZ type B [Methanofollis formosanus]
MKQTFLDRVCESLAGAMNDYNREDVVRQRVVVFPDMKGEWAPIVARLRDILPVITFGTYDPEHLTGPAIYLRGLVAHTIDSPLPRDQPVIVYLPGYSREQLRNLEDCPDEIKPLAGLQYLGNVWSQRNGRDWTLLAFIKTSQGGLSIQVHDDSETRDAIRNAAAVLADESVEFLKTKEPLNASFFNELHHPDPNKQILQWMNDPTGEEQRMKNNSDWGAFCKICGKEYDLEPEKDGASTGADKLGAQVGKWAEVWERFKEKPEAYPQIPQLLRSAKQPKWTVYTDSWPQHNDAQEKELSLKFMALSGVSPEEARKQIVNLEKTHAQRRKWIWAEMGESPLARALEHLAQLATITKDAKFGGTIQEQAERYAHDMWQADDAVVRALEQATDKKNREAITVAVNALYRNWLDVMAEAFQKEWQREPATMRKENQEPTAGEVMIFVDGLRMDLGHRLCSILKETGCSCKLSHHFSALPTQTSTAKPAVMPIAGELNAGEDLTPKTKSGAIATNSALRSILKNKGFNVLSESETGDPERSAWTDCGDIDTEGHNKGYALPEVLDREIKKIHDRTIELLDAGWQQVRIVTDHGWLFLPGKLRKTELKPGLTEVKKGRCAVLRANAVVEYPVVPWFWNRTVRIVLAPGSSCFEGGREYEHGGLSPQETVVPEIVVRKGASRSKGIVIGRITWTGLRCKAHVDGAEGHVADIRLRPADAQSSVTASSREVGIEGNVSLIISDDSMEGRDAWLVVMDRQKNPVAQRNVKIGVE